MHCNDVIIKKSVSYGLFPAFALKIFGKYILFDIYDDFK